MLFYCVSKISILKCFFVYLQFLDLLDSCSAKRVDRGEYQEVYKLVKNWELSLQQATGFVSEFCRGSVQIHMPTIEWAIKSW